MNISMYNDIFLNINPIPESDKAYKIAFPAPGYFTEDISVTVDTIKSIVYVDADVIETKDIPFNNIRFSIDNVLSSVNLKGHPRHMCSVYFYNYYVENGVLFILLNVEKMDRLKIKSTPLSK